MSYDYEMSFSAFRDKMETLRDILEGEGGKEFKTRRLLREQAKVQGERIDSHNIKITERTISILTERKKQLMLDRARPVPVNNYINSLRKKAEILRQQAAKLEERADRQQHRIENADELLQQLDDEIFAARRRMNNHYEDHQAEKRAKLLAVTTATKMVLEGVEE